MSYLRSINIRNFLSQTSAGLDLYAIEPLPENHKLRFLPNVLLTPHIGYVTLDNYAKWYNQMAEDLQAFLDGQPIRVLN